MIDKETLLKKIKNGETVYRVAGSQVREVKLGWGFDVGKYNLLGDVSRNHAKWAFDTLYETKEEAEWALEFGNITRTEKLELPSWEEFQKTHTTINFYKNGCEYGLHRVNYSADRNNPDFKIEVYVFYNDLEESSDDLFSEPLTKENYIKACRLCKKLFLERQND